MNKEMWKDIVGYEGLYWVSNLGNIKSKKCQLKPILNEKGYCKVELSKKGKRKRYFIHRLVAIHFIENAYNKEQINHKDGKLIREYVSIKEASEETGINSRNICNCLSIRQPKSKSAGGYIWKYKLES